MYGLLLRLLKAGAVLLALTAGAIADDYPAKSIRLIIPFPPGGSNDVVGRLVAKHLSDQLGQQVYVDNRGGAGGTIGTDIAAKAAPDGYTLLVISLAHAVNPWLYKLPYDHAKAFTPVASFGSGTNVLAVNPELPVWLGSADRVAFYQLKSMLQGVVQRGTANSMRDLAPYLAGKTGTSEDENDAWFVGFTNDVTVAVWVGYDNASGRRTLGGGSTGGHVAVPIFRPIVEAAWTYVARRAFLAPPSAAARRQLVLLPIDLASGSRVAQGGQGTITEAFRSDGRGRIDDTQYRIVSELDAQTSDPRDDPYATDRPYYADRQDSPDGYRYFGGPQGGVSRVAPQPSPYQQRGLFGSWTNEPADRQPQLQQQPQRRYDPDYFWHNRMN